METLREQLKDEVKTLLRDELTPIVKQELRTEIQEEVRERLTVEISDQLRVSLTQDIREMIEEEEREKIKKDLISLREELTKKLVDEIALKRQQVAKESGATVKKAAAAPTPLPSKRSVPCVPKKKVTRFYGRRLQKR